MTMNKDPILLLDITNAHQKFLNLSSGLSQFQVKLGQNILDEWFNNSNKLDVINSWLLNQQQPTIPTDPFTILHYNIRHFFSNQVDLLDIIAQYKPTVISLNELGTNVPENCLKQLLFSYNIFTNKGSNAHGGVVLAVDKKLKAIQLKYDQENFLAIQIFIKGETFTIVSIYSPPSERLPLEAMSSITKNSNNIIMVGDLNSKHSNWGCSTTNQKGKILADWLDITQALEIQNHGMKTSLRSDTTIDLVLTTPNISFAQCKTLPYLGSDHLPIFIELDGILLQSNFYTVPKTYWDIYRILLSLIYPYMQHELEITYSSCHQEWFFFFQRFLLAIKTRSTILHTAKRNRPTISSSLRLMLKHKHYLQNKYRHSKLETDRLRLRSWSKLIQHELKTQRQNNWLNFISQVTSPNPQKFWHTVKTINKKRSTTFTAITENNHIHKTSQEVINILSDHFSNRFSPPTTNLKHHTDLLATSLWNQLSNSSQDDIELVCSNSDLKFSTLDLKAIIKNMKNSNSSCFDGISNKMVKLLPESYHVPLITAYNTLFSTAQWDHKWKSAKTLCLNKVDNPAPTTNQLRPISLLPTFSKIYEKLFLLKFDKWVQSNNILPPQQSGSRPHLSTLTRVNYLFEQITQSLNHNSFVVILYVDFLQAFDMLWYQGLILKLYQLHCPYAYLFWIINYFTDRTITIEFGDQCSKRIPVSRGAPQGSCFGPKAYILNHFDLPSIFDYPNNVHLYVDDLAIIYSPSIYLKFSSQAKEMESRINKGLLKLASYTATNHQPINFKKTEYVIYRKSVQIPNIKISFQGQAIQRSNSFKYLGFHIDAKLSFNVMLDTQFAKLRKSFTILKYIHCAFPIFFKLKLKFFQTYAWPHFLMLATIFCLLSQTNQNRINSLYRRYLRIIYCIFRTPTVDLHTSLKLPTLNDLFHKYLQKRLKNIQLFEQESLDCFLLYKNVQNELQLHYNNKPFIPYLPTGRPNKRITSLINNNSDTFMDKLINFS